MFKDGKANLDNMKKFTGILSSYNAMNTYFGSHVEETLSNPNVQKLIQANEKFDIVILAEFRNEALRALANHFSGSLILFVTSGVMKWYHDEIGYINLPSIEPVLPTETPYKMSIMQRIVNTFHKLYSVQWSESNMVHQKKLIKKYIPGAPSSGETVNDISLVLVNTDYSVDVARPIVPTMINIGGFHVKQPKKLPENLQQIMDNAKNGVIYICFGSVVDPENISHEKLKAVVDMLSTRKEIFLWKFNGDLERIPKNVILEKWMPQQDILGK